MVMHISKDAPTVLLPVVYVDSNCSDYYSFFYHFVNCSLLSVVVRSTYCMKEGILS